MQGLYDIPLHEPLLQASSIPVPTMRMWSFNIYVFALFHVRVAKRQHFHTAG